MEKDNEEKERKKRSKSSSKEKREKKKRRRSDRISKSKTEGERSSKKKKERSKSKTVDGTEQIPDEKKTETKVSTESVRAKRTAQRRKLAKETQENIQKILQEKEEENEAKAAEIAKTVDALLEPVKQSETQNAEPTKEPKKSELDDFLFDGDDDDDDEDYDDDDDDEDEGDKPKKKSKTPRKASASTAVAGTSKPVGGDSEKDKEGKKEELTTSKIEGDNKKEELIRETKPTVSETKKEVDANDHQDLSPPKKDETTSKSHQEQYAGKEETKTEDQKLASKESPQEKGEESKKKVSSKKDNSKKGKAEKKKQGVDERSPRIKSTRKKSGTQRAKDITLEAPEKRGESPRALPKSLLEETRPLNRSASSGVISRRNRTSTVSTTASPLIKTEKKKTKRSTSVAPESKEDRSGMMVELLFRRLMVNGVLLEPYATAKKLFEAGEPFDIIEKAFDDYESTKHIINVTTGDDSEEEDTPHEPSEEEIEEDELPESEFMKEPSEFVSYDDEWTLANAGGCFNYSTWRKNPQYLLFVDKTSIIELSLAQPKELEIPHHIGFYVFYGNKQHKRVIAKEELIDKCPLDEQSIVSKQIKLAGSTEPYMVVPCTFDPEEIAKFNISAKVIEGPKIKFQRLLKSNDWLKMIIKGKWRKSNAGGCRNYSTHLQNDQFLISSEGRCSGRLILQYRHKENVDELGIYILSAPSELSHKIVHTFDAPLVSKSGFSLPNEALLDFRIDSPMDRLLVIPCTFEPNRYATYRLVVLTDSPVQIQSLEPPKYKEVQDEWCGDTAVGCLNHSRWRYNPQYQLTTNGKVQIQLQKDQENNDTVIGFYVLKSPSGSRQLEVNKDNFVTKASFMNSQSVTAQIDVSSEEDGSIVPQTFTIVPCTFRPNNEAKFSLRAFCSNETSVLELSEAKDDWIESMVTGKWNRGTAGGCINYASWRNNPQIRMVPDEDGEIILALEQEHHDDHPISIGFYVVKSSSTNPRVWNMEPSDILHKAAFKKNFLNLTRMKVEKGVSYNVIPCAFSPWDECSYTFYAYGKSKVSLKRLHRSQQDKQLRVKGKWGSKTSGGCMANTTWPKNPHLLMEVHDKPATMQIMLQQNIAKADTPSAIGFCITKSDEHGFPAISDVDDILYKVNYEEAHDISMNVVIPPSDVPYVITPSTYHPGVKCRFTLQIFTDQSSDVTLSDPHHNFESGEDDFDVIDVQPVDLNSAGSGVRVGMEKMEETLEDEEMLTEQASHSLSHSRASRQESTEPTRTALQDSTVTVTEPNVPPPSIPPPNMPPPPVAPPLPTDTSGIKKPVGGLKKPVGIGKAPSGTSIFDQIKKGTALRTADKQKPLAEIEFTWTPFNVDKIVARRAALEFSDDEGSADEWDDDWDDDDE